MCAAPASSTHVVLRCTDHATVQAASLRLSQQAAHDTWVGEHLASMGLSGWIKAPCAAGTVQFWGKEGLDLESVRQEDPLCKHGVYERVEWRFWRRVISAEGGLGERRWFMVWAVDREGCAELRGETRAAHLDWLRGGGRCLMGGPFLEDGGGAVGSLLVVSGGGLDEVAGWVKQDPYAVAGLFETVDVSELDIRALDGKVTTS